MLYDQCRLGGRVQPTQDQWALYLICVSTARRNCCNRENILKLPQATDTPHFLHVTDQKNLMPLSKFRVGEGEECKPTCAQKRKELEMFELVRAGLTEHNRASNNVASSRNTDVSETVAHSLFLSLPLLQVNTLNRKVSLPQIPMDDHIPNVIAALTTNAT